MKRCLVLLVLTVLVGGVPAQDLEITPLFEVGLWDIALGGANLEGKTLLVGKTSVFEFGGGVRINEQFGAMLGVKGIHNLTLFTEGFEDPIVSYSAFGTAPVSLSLLWFPKHEARARKPFVFLSYTWVHTKLKDIKETFPVTSEFPRNYLGIGAGYTLYAITPHIQLEYVPGWDAMTYTLGVKSGGIFDW